jgi:hypothetical protein
VEPELKSAVFYQEQAARAHRLAKSVADDRVRENLLAVAREYEALVVKAAAAPNGVL